MNDAAEQRERLRNAVAQPVAVLTAVEVDTVAHARDLINNLRPAAADRPNATIEFDACAMQPETLLLDARAAVRGWAAEQGVLFVVDCTRAGQDEATDFWRGMNFQREAWGALRAHVVFLLTPRNYRLLLNVADHLADWVSLRFHFMAPEASVYPERMANDILSISEMLSPSVARERLAQLGRDLASALAAGTEKTALARRYYLPMLQAALSLGDLRRAEALAGQIDASDLADADRPAWLLASTILFLKRYQLPEARKQASQLLADAQSKGDPASEAQATHLLGIIAQEQRDFDTAEQWFRKSLAIKEKQRDKHGAAITYHQLGRIAEEQRDFAAAEQWYRKSLAIEEKQGNEHGAAITYHQLGRIAEEQRDFNAAEQWYRKSLAIKEKHGNEHGAAITYHQLGRIAEEQRDFAAAEQWYRKAVAVFERLHIDHYAAITYHQLGIIAQKQRDFAAAEQWYRKSLAIEEKQSNEHGAAITCGQLGILAGLQGAYEESAQWLIRCVKAFAACNDPHGAKRNGHIFAVFLSQADEPTQRKMAAMWREAGLGPLPKPQA